MKIKTIRLLVLSFLLSYGVIKNYAQTISVSGSWALTIDETKLQGGAGTDLIDTYESNTNQIIVDISAPGWMNWRVDVSKVDQWWPAEFHLWVRKTADGSGNGSISPTGITGYIEVTGSGYTLYQGSRRRTGVNVQLKLSGVSLQVAPDVYTTTVYYTLVQI